MPRREIEMDMPIIVARETCQGDEEGAEALHRTTRAFKLDLT